MSAPQYPQPGPPQFSAPPAGYVLPDGQWVPVHQPETRLPENTPPWTLRYTWRDTVFLIVYILVLVLGLPALLYVGVMMALGHGVDFKDPQILGFLQVLTYVVLTGIAVALILPDMRRAAKTFTDRPGLKWGMVPVWFFGNLFALILVGALVQALTGGVDQSANQKGLQEMAKAIPFWEMVIATVFCAPFVEEYLFRNILIGKLSRRLNQWVCLAISSVSFMLLHALAGWPENPLTLLPYLAMGLTFGVIYIWSGKSFVYSTIIHALHNLVALTMVYYLPDAPL